VADRDRDDPDWPDRGGLEHVFRTVFAKPLAASAFLFINELILFAAE